MCVPNRFDTNCLVQALKMVRGGKSWQKFNDDFCKFISGERFMIIKNLHKAIGGRGAPAKAQFTGNYLSQIVQQINFINYM